MAENEAPIVHHNPSSEPPNPLSSIISKFTQLFNFRFPPPPKKVETAGFRGEEVAEDQKSVTVMFPDNHTTATVTPVKLEPAELDQNTNPAVLWQVYAIGGFFFMRWVLARWKERRANKKQSSEDSPPPPSPQTEAATEPDE